MTYGSHPPGKIVTIAKIKQPWNQTMGLLPNTSNCRCASAGNAGNVFPTTAGKQSRHASRHVLGARAVMHAGIAVSFEFGGGGKRSRHSRRMRNPQFYVSGKGPMLQWINHALLSLDNRYIFAYTKCLFIEHYIVGFYTDSCMLMCVIE